jgi:hypothetical protein
MAALAGPHCACGRARCSARGDEAAHGWVGGWVQAAISTITRALVKVDTMVTPLTAQQRSEVARALSNRAAAHLMGQHGHEVRDMVHTQRRLIHTPL